MAALAAVSDPEPEPRPNDPLAVAWRAEWPAALAAWSAYTLLRDPRVFSVDVPESMRGQLACIRLRDHVILLNADEIRARGLGAQGLAILAHEIGHHVYVPGNLTDHARHLAAMQHVLQGLPSTVVAMAANLYADLLINDRLQRRAGVDIAAVYLQLTAARRQAGQPASAVWSVYCRIMEHLWRLPDGALVDAGALDAEGDGDALLCSELIRAFAGDWLRGARRFATVMCRYLVADESAHRDDALAAAGLADTRAAGHGVPGQPSGDAIPDGLVEIDDAESGDDGTPKPGRQGDKARGQTRTPFEYGQLLRALGLDLDEGEVTRRYYRERALPHLLPFPTRRNPRADEPLPEGQEPWAAGDPLETLDLFGSILHSPHVIPGVTTVQRTYGQSVGWDPAPRPLDLDIYVDCSGSMPDPRRELSYLALAGTILALSALRAGARVQATLWSDAQGFDTTHGFIRDEARILAMITGYISGGTAFPLHVLRDTYAARKPDAPPAHIVVISDDGADTMLQADERGNPGLELCREALRQARAGGTLVLNLQSPWPSGQPLLDLGFALHAVGDWAQLLTFARAFVRQTFK